MAGARVLVPRWPAHCHLVRAHRLQCVNTQACKRGMLLETPASFLPTDIPLSPALHSCLAHSCHNKDPNRPRFPPSKKEENSPKQRCFCFGGAQAGGNSWAPLTASTALGAKPQTPHCRYSASSAHPCPQEHCSPSASLQPLTDQIYGTPTTSRDLGAERELQNGAIM